MTDDFSDTCFTCRHGHFKGFEVHCSLKDRRIGTRAEIAAMSKKKCGDHIPWDKKTQVAESWRIIKLQGDNRL